MEGKRQGYPQTQTLFWGPRPFCGVEYFPEPVETVAFPKESVKKYRINYKFKGPLCVQ